MLPHEKLAPHYDDVVWLYVCRTWDEDEQDLEAARIHDRFGVTSWPHLFFVDPRDDRVLVRAGRNLDALRDAVRRATEAVPEPSAADRDLVQRLAAASDAAALGVLAAGEDAVEVAFEARERLRELEGGSERTVDALLADTSPHERVRGVEMLARGDRGAVTPERRTKLVVLLADPAEDVVVRFRALLCLLALDPATALRTATPLLLTGNDAVRFALLDAMAEHPDPEQTATLIRLFAEAGRGIPSGNPNVLRMRAARVLAVAGDARAIPVLGPMAREAVARNVTTRLVVEALGQIASRADPDAAARVVEILLSSYPAAVEREAGTKPSTSERYARRLAKAVTAALAAATQATDLPAPPGSWTAEAREAYLESVRSSLP